MKKKKNLIILLAVILIGLIAFFIAKGGSRDATFDQDFHIEDVNSITKVFMADKQDNNVLLQRDANLCIRVIGIQLHGHGLGPVPL